MPRATAPAPLGPIAGGGSPIHRSGATVSKPSRIEEILKVAEPHSTLERCMRSATEGRLTMRDIREDLQERADLAQDRMKALDLHFKRRLEMLRRECEANTSELKTVLATIIRLMEFEDRRMGGSGPVLAKQTAQELDQAV